MIYIFDINGIFIKEFDVFFLVVRLIVILLSFDFFVVFGFDCSYVVVYESGFLFLVFEDIYREGEMVVLVLWFVYMIKIEDNEGIRVWWYGSWFCG